MQRERVVAALESRGRHPKCNRHSNCRATLGRVKPPRSWPTGRSSRRFFRCPPVVPDLPSPSLAPAYRSCPNTRGRDRGCTAVTLILLRVPINQLRAGRDRWSDGHCSAATHNVPTPVTDVLACYTTKVRARRATGCVHRVAWLAARTARRARLRRPLIPPGMVLGGFPAVRVGSARR